jgi:uncharacterized protein
MIHGWEISRAISEFPASAPGRSQRVVKLDPMSPMRTDTFDLGGLRLTSGEGRRLDLQVAIEPFSLADETYAVQPDPVPVRLDISRTTGDGYALRLRFEASLVGPCMRCLEPAAPSFAVDAREVSQPRDSRRHAGGTRPGRGRSEPGRGPGRGRGEPGRGPGRGCGEPDANDELSSPYVEDGVLDLRGWARDALALSVPSNLLCSEDCAGLCPVCGANLNEAGPDHAHELQPDPRWAALSNLRFE